MGENLDAVLLDRLIDLTRDVSAGQYDRSSELFELTKTGSYPEKISELAESFGMMVVKVEAREYRLEQMIEELRQKNLELAASLSKVEMLEKIKGHLSKFVPQTVQRLIESAPETPDLTKREQDLSVVFLDIAGYTRMSERLDTEMVNQLVERYFSSFLEDIHRHQGDINETAGDGLMILFQDQDAQAHAGNAVATAVAIQAKVEAINRQMAGSQDPLVVNIGINTGRALVGSSRFESITGPRYTFTATGPVTNLAARIAGLASRGEILIGPDTAARIDQDFEVVCLGPKRLKNVAEEVPVYQVLLG